MTRTSSGWRHPRWPPLRQRRSRLRLADWAESLREKAKLSSADEIEQRREADFPKAIQGRWLDDADRIQLEIIFPGNEEEGSSTSLFRMDDGALGYATWHEACTYLRPDA